MTKMRQKNVIYVIFVAVLLIIAYYSRALHTEVSLPIPKMLLVMNGWSTKNYWLCDLCDIRGNLTLTPIWIKYDITKISDTKRKFSYEIDKKYDYFSCRTVQIRYSANRNMKKAKTLWCYNSWKGSFILKKLKKGKKYYVQFRTRDEDSKSPWSNPRFERLH